MRFTSVSFPAAKPANAMNTTTAHISAQPRRPIGSAVRWSAKSGNTTLCLFEKQLKAPKKMQMPIGTGPVKSKERLAVERELQKHSKQGVALTPQRLVSILGADLDLVRKILANMRKQGTAVNVGTLHAPAYRTPERRQESAPAALANPRTVTGRGPYEGKELRPFDGRPGAMDAFLLPSVVNGQRTEPRRPVAMCVSAIKNRKTHMKLPIKKLHENAIVPTYATDGSGACDLYAATVNGASSIGDVCYPGHPVIVDTGIAFEVPQGYMLRIASRSGLAFRHGITAFPGVIDSDFRASVKVMLTCAHLDDDAPPTKIAPGDRVAQAYLCLAPRIEFEVVEELSSTVRGADGFGSTGV